MLKKFMCFFLPLVYVPLLLHPQSENETSQKFLPRTLFLLKLFKELGCVVSRCLLMLPLCCTTRAPPLCKLLLERMVFSKKQDSIRRTCFYGLLIRNFPEGDSFSWHRNAFFGIEIFDLLFGIKIFFDLHFTGCRGPNNTRVDPRKKIASMPNTRMLNLDTKKISIPKKRLRPPRYHKKDISIPEKDATLSGTPNPRIFFL